MEWVVMTGRSVQEATEAALDELGVDESELDLEVLEEPRPGLFGRVRGEAKVRARVRPTQARPKVERRKRGNGRSSSKGRRSTRSSGGDETADQPATPDEAEAEAIDEVVPEAQDAVAPPVVEPPDAPTDGGDTPDEGGAGGRSGRRTRGGRRRSTSKDGPRSGSADQGAAVSNVSVEEQVDVMEEFLEGLLDAFDLDGDIEVVEIDDETSEVRVDGDDLGLLIGPKGQTLSAVQDLARTVAQRRLPGPHDGRVRVDVAGYRERRRAALERFAAQVADDVLESGTRKALEPMNAADRKIVHDVINDVDGVTTVSEGEEPRRRVVVEPED